MATYFHSPKRQHKQSLLVLEVLIIFCSSAVLCISIVLMPIRIQIFMLMPILMWILPKALNKLEKSDFFLNLSQSIATLQSSSFSLVSNVSYVFSTYFGAANKKSPQRNLLYQLFHLLRIERNPDPAKWCGSDPIPIRIHNTAYQCARIRGVCYPYS